MVEYECTSKIYSTYSVLVLDEKKIQRSCVKIEKLNATQAIRVDEGNKNKSKHAMVQFIVGKIALK